MSFQTPVLFLIFNRPDQTKKVFEAIRQVKPKYLFIAADGPREFKEGEYELCDQARTIATTIEWDCNVKTLFRDINIGCGRAVSEAITWFFENVEEGIILEDDCLPSPDFFTFCTEMLLAYKDDERIMQVSGTNALREWKSDKQSYHFSNYGSIWGWATWRRAWNYYDFNISLWANNEVKERLKDILINKAEYAARYNIFDNYFKGHREDTWDYQWSFARLCQSGLSIVPSINLISNIGFGEGATHTISLNSDLAELPSSEFSSVINRQAFVMVDRDYDYHLMLKHGIKEVNPAILERNFRQRSLSAIKSLIKSFIA